MRPLSAIVTLVLSSLAVFGPTLLCVLRVTPEQSVLVIVVVIVIFDRPVVGSFDSSVDAKRIFAIVLTVVGRVEWRDPITLRFTPETPLQPATEYTVTVANDFAAMDGSQL